MRMSFLKKLRINRSNEGCPLPSNLDSLQEPCRFRRFLVISKRRCVSNLTHISVPLCYVNNTYNYCGRINAKTIDKYINLCHNIKSKGQGCQKGSNYMEIKKETPSNITQLVKNANNKNSWEIRLAALNALRCYDCQQSKDVIIRLALHDKVYKVKEEAFRAAQAMGYTYRGAPIRLGRKDIGYSSKDFTKSFLRIKREKAMDDLDLEVFKDTFKNLNPEMYDVMAFEKGNKFDEWIINTYKSLPKK